jgi:hypothetical protein
MILRKISEPCEIDAEYWTNVQLSRYHALTMTNHDTTRLLTVLYAFHAQGRDPTFMRLVRETGIGADPLMRAFDELAALELVNPERMRLTLAGVAAARLLRNAGTAGAGARAAA